MSMRIIGRCGKYPGWLTAEDTEDTEFLEFPPRPLCPPWSMNLFQNLLCIQHTFGRFFMLEVCKHIALLP